MKNLTLQHKKFHNCTNLLLIKKSAEVHHCYVQGGSPVSERVYPLWVLVFSMSLHYHAIPMFLVFYEEH